MGILFIILLVIGLIQTLREPYWGIVLLFLIILLGKPFDDFLPDSELAATIVGIITLFSYLVHYSKGSKQVSFFIPRVFVVSIIFTLYIFLSHPDFSYLEGERNWIFTYLQLSVLIFLAANLITSKHQLVVLTWALWSASIITVLYFIYTYFFETLPTDEFKIEGGNTYARYFLIASGFAYYLLKEQANSLQTKIILIISIIVLATGILLTISRSVIIMGVFLMVYIFLRESKLNFGNFIAAAGLGLLILLFFPNDIFNKVSEKFNPTTYEGTHGTGELGTIDNNIRKILWAKGLEMWLEGNLATGIGIGQAKQRIMDYFPLLSHEIGLHNMYLSVLFETGYIGFILFSTLLFLSLKNFLGDKSTLSQMWMIAFIILLIGGLTKHDHYNKLLFLMFGISAFISRYTINLKQN